MFEKFIRYERTDRYDIMCAIDAHEKENSQTFYYGRSGGGNALLSNSTTEALV